MGISINEYKAKVGLNKYMDMIIPKAF